MALINRSLSRAVTVGVPRKKQGHHVTFGCMGLGDQDGELLAERRGSRRGCVASTVFLCMRLVCHPGGLPLCLKLWSKLWAGGVALGEKSEHREELWVSDVLGYRKGQT